VEGDGPDGLRRRRMMTVTRLATIPRNTPPITPPAIAPTFDLLFVVPGPELEETGAELPVVCVELVADWVGLVAIWVKLVVAWVELDVAWVELAVAWVELAVGGRADDSRPPAISASPGSNILAAVTSR